MLPLSWDGRTTPNLHPPLKRVPRAVLFTDLSRLLRETTDPLSSSGGVRALNPFTYSGVLLRRLQLDLRFVHCEPFTPTGSSLKVHLFHSSPRNVHPYRLGRPEMPVPVSRSSRFGPMSSPTHTPPQISSYLSVSRRLPVLVPYRLESTCLLVSFQFRRSPLPRTRCLHRARHAPPPEGGLEGGGSDPRPPAVETPTVEEP